MQAKQSQTALVCVKFTLNKAACSKRLTGVVSWLDGCCRALFSLFPSVQHSVRMSRRHFSGFIYYFSRESLFPRNECGSWVSNL